MKWAALWAFIFFIPFIFICLRWFAKNKQWRSALQFSTVKFANFVSGGLRARFAFLPNLLKVFAIALAIVALARPQQANKKVNKNVEGIDVMLALDVSDSMMIEDMAPENRITAAKTTVRKFIQGRVSDRIGLIIFAAESYTRCPLTLDYDVLLHSLDTVTTDNIKQGTAIGVALANAVARLKESNAKSRVIILLTDGESNSGLIDPDTATEIAKGFGIRVYTIGVGTNGQAQLPVWTVDAFGNRVKHYEPIHSTINEELLQRIASETGGKYFRAVDTDTLKKVFTTIGGLEKSKIEINRFVKYSELFDSWLFWAVVFYLAQLILSQTVLRRAP